MYYMNTYKCLSLFTLFNVGILKTIIIIKYQRSLSTTVSYLANDNRSQTPSGNRFGLAKDPLCVATQAPVLARPPNAPSVLVQVSYEGKDRARSSSYSTTLFSGVQEHATTRRQVFEIVAPGRCCSVVSQPSFPRAPPHPPCARARLLPPPPPYLRRDVPLCFVPSYRSLPDPSLFVTKPPRVR